MENNWELFITNNPTESVIIGVKNTVFISFFEWFCLLFIKSKRIKVFAAGDGVVIYKVFRNKLYVINHFMTPPEGWRCRHRITWLDETDK